MWPFKNKDLSSNGMHRYRNWLKRWLLGGWFIYASIAVIMLATVMVPTVRGQLAQWLGDSLITGVTSEVYQQKMPEDSSKEIKEKAVIPTEYKEKTQEKVENKDVIGSGQKQISNATSTVNQQNKEEVTLTELVRPVNGAVITGYGEGFSELYEDYRFHDGLDFAAKPGTDVKAAAKGKVTEITEDSHGVTVSIEQGSAWSIKYSGIGKAKVIKGQSVKSGEVIGTIGRNIGDIKEAHLHFALSIAGKSVNPVPYFDFN